MRVLIVDLVHGGNILAQRYLSEGGEDQVVTVEVPATWEVQPQYNSTPNLYLDMDLTIPYRYPGDGEAYTIYASDAEG